jgi:hypothetical protein
MLAWQRNNVADLNRLARDAARRIGWLQGRDMQTTDGRLFAVGDIVVLLAPNYRGQLVTSERAQVVAVDSDAEAVTIETEHRRRVTLLGSELTSDHLDYGYALTVHREQGATSDRTHYFADGGGRELAYVGISRARHHTTIHTVADDLGQAVERLRDDWSRLQHDTWLSPTTSVGEDARHAAVEVIRIAERARLERELVVTLALPPPDVTDELAATVARLDAFQAERAHLSAGTGPFQGTRIGRVVRQLHDLGDDLRSAREAHANARLWELRGTQRLVNTLERYHAGSVADWHRQGRPIAERLDDNIAATEQRVTELERRQSLNETWHRLHPEHAHRVRHLRQAIADLDHGRALPAACSIGETGAPDVADDLATAIELLDDANARLDRFQHGAEPFLHDGPEPELELPGPADDVGIGL